jgi:hypothetical protein
MKVMPVRWGRERSGTGEQCLAEFMVRNGRFVTVLAAKLNVPALSHADVRVVNLNVYNNGHAHH